MEVIIVNMEHVCSSMARYAPFVGPLVFVALGYMDPGNWATAIEGGSRFGFELLWVVIFSHIMAALFQILATRLELVTGKHLAQICRDDYPQPVYTSLWILCEISIIASELTMVLGTAVGLNLLLGIPILPAVFFSVFDTLVFQVVLPLMGLQSAEFLTRIVVGVILVCFGMDALLSPPNAMVIAVGMRPKLRGDTLYTVMALLGANVMPHTFYLRSPLAKRQITTDGSQSVETLCEKSMWDAIGAFGFALVANAVLLIVAATSFYNTGLVVLTLQDAHALMEQVFSNSIAPAVFGLAMLCAGQLSTHTGSSGEQAALEGFLDTRVQPWIHQSVLRGAAIVPTAFCAWQYGNEGLYQLLVFAQVLVTLLLPFTALPLIKASTSEARMGSFRTPALVEAAAWVSVALVVIANTWLVFGVVLQEIDEFAGFAAQLEHLLGTDSFGNYGGETMNASIFALALVGIGLFVGLLVWLVVTPLRMDRIAMERKAILAELATKVVETSQESQYGEGSDSTTETFTILEVAPQDLERTNSIGSSLSAVVEDDLFAELDVIALPEPESQVLEEVELEGLVTSLESLSAEEEHPKCVHLPAQEKILVANTEMVPMPLPASVEQQPVDGLVCTADNLESTGSKTADVVQQADTELLEKVDDKANGWEKPQPGGLLVDTMVTGDLGASSESLTHNGPHSVTSVGDRSETAEGNLNSNGSGSLSRISGLGRAARRQFAAILDDFWSKLFDLHGQPVKQQQGGTANGRIAGSRAGARGAIQQQQQQVDHGSLPMQPGSTEGFDRDDYGMLLKPKHCLLLKKGSLGDQVSQKDTYMRAHSHAGASTSLLFSGHSNDYSGRLENLSPYTSERKYSSLHLPLYPEETHKQPATIHGYRSPSFLGRSAGTPSPAYMGTQAFRSAYTPSGQALSHQPLGVGVERESDNYQLYGRSLQGDSGLLVQDTIQSRHTSQHIIDSLPGRTPLHSRVTERLLLREGYGGQLDSGPQSWDSLLNHAALDCLVHRATGELDIPMAFDHSSPATKGVGASERAPPLSFDQISPPQSYRDGFSIQSARLENHSLWSRQPSEQLFGAALDGSSSSVRGNNSQVSSQNGINNRFTTAVRPEGIITQNNNTAMGSANRVDSELEVIESLHLCLSKLLQLEGAEWLFRMDNGSDEDLVAAVATAEKSKLTAAETHDQYSSPDQWQAHSHPMTSLFNSNKLARTLHSCGDSCVWGKKGLLISFGVWSVHRLLELSLMESRPELWGKYTYVLNRLQGILEPAFSKPRAVPSLCGCLLEPGSAENFGKQGVRVTQQRNYFQDSLNGDTYSPPLVGGLSDIQAWAQDPDSTSFKGRGADATLFLEMIKEVEAAVGSRKGRTGTAAGDVAFPKGKENLASVLKRYKRRLTNKPPGSLVVGGGGAGAGGGGRRGNGYA
ncbi:unnamed protein product [Sphagnum jensenii]|uniref:Natural resistance-associated macrophage protein n=1 Tax=Sphagnum jensenii TaxID=128206 RepID=A0ABP0VKC5_9BRYO